MRRTLPGLTGLAAVALVLSACGGGGAASPSADKTDHDALKATLTWWDTSDPTNEAPAFKQLIKKFNAEYPNVKINYQSVPFGEAQNKFKTAAEAGEGAPDILRAEVAWVPEFAAAGHLYALDGSDVLKDNHYLDTALSSDVYNGKTYGVPQVTDTLGLMYNKKLFKEAGIDEAPTTWAEVKADAKLLKQKAHVDGIYLNSGGYFLLPFMYGEGGDLVDTKSKTIEVASQANKDGIKVAQDMVKSGAAPKPDANDSYGTMMTLFKEGKVGMVINGPWEVANVSKDPKFGGFDNLGIAPVPAGSKGAGAPVGGHNYVVYSGMDEKKADAATAFLEFMTSAKSEAFIADKLGLLPTNEDAYDLVKDNPRITAWKAALDVAKARPWIPEGGLFFGPLDEMATKVLVQGADVDKTLDQTAAKYKSDVVPAYDLP
ncbi:sugar ABC transporter substrate-binding protein [Nocardioides phosphati]|uniref:Sugar ABC transporter substrate-binding protein n=1 Tax=Nocardioides phosphati TaxID=1867775 RepID=A0ABQ2NAT4_9ACTN|nr:extracellular solute-binding protein [Nocardioides phosphati]GGO89583.1 sugar ABC transporter substrate-binding protein [Nocardioides phosphati]